MALYNIEALWQSLFFFRSLIVSKDYTYIVWLHVYLLVIFVIYLLFGVIHKEVLKYFYFINSYFMQVAINAGIIQSLNEINTVVVLGKIIKFFHIVATFFFLKKKVQESNRKEKKIRYCTEKYHCLIRLSLVLPINLTTGDQIYFDYTKQTALCLISFSGLAHFGQHLECS